MEYNDEHISSVLESQSIKDTTTRKVAFKTTTLRKLFTMASHYYFEKNLKKDELLSLIIEQITNDYYKNNFLNDIKEDHE